jgi:iron transport multicopper oxidase
MDVNAFDNVPGYLSQNATGYLVYDASKPLPPPPSISTFQITDDIDLTPYDKQPALRNPTKRISLDLNFFPDSDQNRAGFNGISYTKPRVPTLYSVLSAPSDLVNNSQIYGNSTHAIILQAQDVVEITINNGDDGQHPLHIHGHQVQIISRVPGQPRKKKQKFRASNAISSMPGAPPSRASIPFPIRRDTFTLAGSGTTVIRFVADNPGVWHFHCHMEWHLSAGLGLVLIEAPDELRATQAQVSPSMQQICKGQGIPTSGNAMGNTVNWMDVSGQP